MKRFFAASAALLIMLFCKTTACAGQEITADLSQGEVSVYADESRNFVKYYSSGEQKISALGQNDIINIIQSGEKYTSNTVSVYSDASINIIFNNINIIAENSPAVSISGGSAVAEIVGECSFSGAQGFAGAECAPGASLSLHGNGTLTCRAGADGAGIGANAGKSSGNISISGLTVYAYGSSGGAGIGGGRSGNGGEIKLSDCTIYAENDRKSFSGNHLGDEENPGEGGAGIGGGAAGASNNITITRSAVTAYGGNKAAGIGSGFWRSNEGVIKITSSAVTSYGGNTAAGIGGGRGNTDSKGSGGTIILENSDITAYGGKQGAGIGSGFNNRSSDYVGGGSITVLGGSVTAYGGAATAPDKYDGGAGIGGGYKGHTGSVKISGGARVIATGARGASAIGCGADGSSYKAVGGSIELESGSEIYAYSDGTKWAVDLTAEVSGVSRAVLQGRFISGALLPGVTPLRIRNASPQPVLPDAYRCFACPVPGTGTYYVEALEREKYPVYIASYLKNEGDTAFFTRFTLASDTLYSFDFLDFRAGLSADSSALPGEAEDSPPEPDTTQTPDEETTSTVVTSEESTVQQPQENKNPDTDGRGTLALLCFACSGVSAVLCIRRKNQNP